MPVVSAVITIKLNTSKLLDGGRKYTRDVLTGLSEAVRDQAKENVAPGKGPGPHPHRDTGWVWDDTGLLRSSIDNAVVSHAEAWVFSNLNYPRPYNVYLELSWIGPSGRRYAYPWLWPASSAAQEQFRDIALRHRGSLVG